MTRTLTVRVSDEQYDWLVDRVDEFDGELSAAIRDAIDAAQILYRLMADREPQAAFAALLEKSRSESMRDSANASELGESA